MIDITVLLWLALTFGVAWGWEKMNPPKGNFRIKSEKK